MQWGRALLSEMIRTTHIALLIALRMDLVIISRIGRYAGVSASSAALASGVGDALTIYGGYAYIANCGRGFLLSDVCEGVDESLSLARGC